MKILLENNQTLSDLYEYFTGKQCDPNKNSALGNTMRPNMNNSLSGPNKNSTMENAL